ncbi:Dolichol-phosphate mannosyltransferase subunit 3 [Lecanosticta acicola]|uniref:Large ribosomal subunit protein mL50 n=1 Tax=Lecanosticta acicola TaxID=111012 RepID=A0AAI8Z3R8_9PEZI|nr:Dolichol-phosphate mannosyltransferase subunit 3 [Lecanosticta acicola]
MRSSRIASQAMRLAAEPTRKPYICRACLAQGARQFHASSRNNADVPFWKRMKESVFGSEDATRDEASREEKQRKRLEQAAEGDTGLQTKTDRFGNEYVSAEIVDPSTRKDYKPANTWEGLERIGSEAWVRKRADQGEKYVGFMPRRPLQLADVQWQKLLHHITVEVLTLSAARRNVLQICNRGTVSAEAWALTAEAKIYVRGDRAFAQWDRMGAEQSLLARMPRGEQNPFSHAGSAPELKAAQGEGWHKRRECMKVSLGDPMVKLAILKRVMQLTGKRIPDVAVSDAKTVQDLYDAFKTKEKPKKLYQTEEMGSMSKQLRNVTVHPERQTSDEQAGEHIAYINRMANGPVRHTVNPADLMFSSNEHDQSAPVNADAPDPQAQGNIWSGTPVYAREPAVSFDQANHLPSTGWEHLMWTGDLSYSSHDSSPADNAFGWQSLVHRFGEQDLAMSPADGFDSASMSRNVSFATSDQSSFQTEISFPDKRVDRPRQTRPHRGQVYADMSVSGTEAVLEDSDSHDSWTTAENVGPWCARFRERLLQFRRHKDRVSVITSPLQTRQRTKVHSMANLWGLSHTSIGTGRSKRMLLSKCELTPTSTSSEKRWNPTRDNWSRGLVNPTIILVDFVSLQLSSGRIQQCLREAGLPTPKRLTIDYNTKTSPMPQYATVYAMFQRVEEAMEVILALDGSRPNWNGVDTTMESDFVHFPPGFDLSDTALQAFDSLPGLMRSEKARLSQQKSLLKSSNPYPSETEEEEETEDDAYPDHMSSKSAAKTPRQRYFRNTSHGSPHSRDPGYASATSLPSDHDHDSETSTSRKRKRIPKVPGGFPCAFEDCHRVFDRDGDRRKHEKNHTARRPHACTHCGKGFLFPKDLRRHVRGVHEGGNGSDTGGGGGGGEVEEDGATTGTQPVPIAAPLRQQDRFRRLYQTKPFVRGTSKLSSSYS